MAVLFQSNKLSIAEVFCRRCNGCKFRERGLLVPHAAILQTATSRPSRYFDNLSA